MPNRTFTRLSVNDHFWPTPAVRLALDPKTGIDPTLPFEVEDANVGIQITKLPFPTRLSMCIPATGSFVRFARREHVRRSTRPSFTSLGRSASDARTIAASFSPPGRKMRHPGRAGTRRWSCGALQPRAVHRSQLAIHRIRAAIQKTLRRGSLSDSIDSRNRLETTERVLKNSDVHALRCRTALLFAWLGRTYRCLR